MRLIFLHRIFSEFYYIYLQKASIINWIFTAIIYSQNGLSSRSYDKPYDDSYITFDQIWTDFLILFRLAEIHVEAM